MKESKRGKGVRGPSLSIDDAAVSESLAEKLGHPEPFTVHEVERVESLSIMRAHSLRALASCTGLRRLIVDASEIADLTPLAGLPKLSSISASFNALRDISAVRALPALNRVYFAANLIEDASPLLSVKLLLDVTLLGNPLDQHSQKVVLSELRATQLNTPVPLPRQVTADTSADWALTQALQARGWDAVFYRAEQSGSTFVVRPGLRFSQQPEFRSIPIEPAQLEKELANPRLTYDELAAKYWRSGVW